MRKTIILLALVAFFLGGPNFIFTHLVIPPPAYGEAQVKGEIMKLPEPKFKSSTSLEEALWGRRSVREYRKDSLSIEQIAQLLWAAQGTTGRWGGRAVPSAGALYPLEIYLVAGEVKGLKPGLYRYDPGEHGILLRKAGDLRERITRASLDQDEISRAPASLIITAVYARTQQKYGERGTRYVHMETGFVGENVYLQAESLNLGTVFIGAFDDREVKEVMEIEEEPLGIMPVGKK